MYICIWSSAPYTVTEKLLYIIKGPMKVISGLLPETWGYFCMKNFISTTYSQKHTFYFVCLAQGTPSVFFLAWLVVPLNSWALGAPSWLTPPLSGSASKCTSVYKIWWLYICLVNNFLRKYQTSFYKGKGPNTHFLH